MRNPTTADFGTEPPKFSFRLNWPLFLGLVSAALALGLSQTCSWIICSKVFNISFSPFLLESFYLIAATVLLIVAVGLLPSISILRQKPVVFLRNQSQE